MVQESQMADFLRNLDNVIEKKIEERLKYLQVERRFSGNVIRATEVNGGLFFDVDLVFTILRNVPNKSGLLLSVGDTVEVYEKYGSNFSDVYIGLKHTISGQDPIFSIETIQP